MKYKLNTKKNFEFFIDFKSKSICKYYYYENSLNAGAITGILP